MGSSTLNRSGTLPECCNLPQKNNAPHWAPIGTQGCFPGQYSLLFVLWAPNLQQQSQLSTQLSMHLLSKSTFMIFRRWSYCLPYVLYRLWFIPIWFTPCIIKRKHLLQSFNMHFTITQLNQINSIASNNNRQLPEDQCMVHKQTDVYSLKSSCVLYQRTQHSPLYSF